MSRCLKSNLIILFSCLSSIVFGDTNYQPANPVWQEEFGYEGFSCFPQLLNVENNKTIFIIGTMYNQRDPNSIGRIWQWTLDEKTGKRLSDITLKSAKPKDCRLIQLFWITKGLDVTDSNECQIFVDPMERGGKQSLIKNKEGHVFQSYEVKTQATANGFSAGRMKRINSKEYLLFGSEKKGPNGIIQKRNNSGDVIWEKQYQYEGVSRVTDIAQSKVGDLLVAAGLTGERETNSFSAWVNIIADDGAVINREVFNLDAFDLVRVPQAAVLDNNNIAMVYNIAAEGQLTNIEYRIYSKNLELKLKDSVYTWKQDFLYYGMATIDGGFVIVHNAFESGGQCTILNQYDCDGKKIKAIKIDGVGVLANQVIIDSKGKMVYLASLKTPDLLPARTVVTALKLE